MEIRKRKDEIDQYSTIFVLLVKNFQNDETLKKTVYGIQYSNGEVFRGPVLVLRRFKKRYLFIPTGTEVKGYLRRKGRHWSSRPGSDRYKIDVKISVSVLVRNSSSSPHRGSTGLSLSRSDVEGHTCCVFCPLKT